MERQTENMFGFRLMLTNTKAYYRPKVNRSIIFRSGMKQILVIFRQS
jgi:hypothetical protein